MRRCRFDCCATWFAFGSDGAAITRREAADLAALSPAALAGRERDALPRLVQLAMWASRSFPRLQSVAPFMRAAVATLVRDERTRLLLSQLFVYVLSTAPPDVDAQVIRSIFLEIAGPEGQEDVMNAAEQLIEEGREQGRTEGLRVAIAAALSTRAILLSEVGRARIAACVDVATLTQWLTRAVTAASEAEVFAGEGAP